MTGTILISTDQTMTYSANVNSTKWILDEGISIHVVQGASALNAAVMQPDRHFEIRGSIIAEQGIGLYLGGTSNWLLPNTVFVAETGVIDAYTYGMLVYGPANEIVNAGIIKSDLYGVALLDEDGALENSGEIHAGSEALLATGADQHLVNSGTIKSDTQSGLMSWGANSVIENLTGGSITTKGGYVDAVVISGSRTSLLNEGFIQGFHGVDVLDDDIRIDNSGTITGDVGITIDEVSRDTMVVNSGTISGDLYAIVSIGNRTDIVNTGALDGDVLLGNSDDVFSNNGLVGDVFLSAGDDTFILRGGTCGTVDGGAGDDIFRLSVAASIIEAPAEGTDTVVANMTWALGDNLENLTLGGRRNSAGTGNELDNTLKGNRGENHLSGLSGDDELTGGRGADIFVYKTGGGTDTVTDFGKGADRIDLAGWGEVTSFADLKSHHVKTGHGDVIIQAGSGKLILLDTALSELDASDFLF